MTDVLVSATIDPVTTTSDPTTSVCPCGAGPHPTRADICEAGHFVVGNQARRTHGVRAFETTGRLPDVMRMTIEAFRDAIIADRGGASELSTLESAYVRRLSEVEAVARLLASDLASRGLTTPRGRVRNTFSKWMECIDRWDRLAQRVGTDRRPRALPSLTEYMNSQSDQTIPVPETGDRT